MAKPTVDRIARVSAMKRGMRGSSRGDITSSLGSNLAQARIGLGQRAAAQQLHRLYQRAGGVARLFLEGPVMVERIVAGRIGLVIAHVAVELCGLAGRDQPYIVQPVDEDPAQ